MTPHHLHVNFQDTQTSLSQTLASVKQQLPKETVSVRELLHLIGEQGLLFLCVILVIPFLTPIPLPGISTVFGLLIMLISIGVIVNRVPWLPRQLLDRTVSSQSLASVLQHGANLFTRVERLVRPRLPLLTYGSSINRLNGVLLFLAGLLLIVPLPVIPFSNMLPGLAILCLAVGMLQRDGLFVLIGWVFVAVTFVYFAVIAIGVIAAGGSLLTLLSEAASMATPTP